jgi:hypothetical protein
MVTAVILASLFISGAIVMSTYLVTEAKQHEDDTKLELEKLKIASATALKEASEAVQQKAVEEYNKKNDDTSTFLQALANIDKVWEEANK